MEVDFKKVGKRIARRRRILGLKQAEVNERAELSDKYLSHIETGRTTPSIQVLLKICDALETTPDVLLLGAVENELDFAAIQDKLKLLKSERQAELVSEFIDWVAVRKI